MSCGCFCSLPLPHGAVSLSAVCNCGISLSYSLTFCDCVQWNSELLYGKETATDLEYEALFLNMQDFIIHSKRFE